MKINTILRLIRVNNIKRLRAEVLLDREIKELNYGRHK